MKLIKNQMEYKVIITTSGIGSRLKELTKTTNKALVPINGKATIDYVIDRYPKEIPIVVTLGYYGAEVKKYLETTFPDRIFEFVKVDPYTGPGSSLGYSLLQAKSNLRCPFIFHACDTIILENIPIPKENWLGGYIVPENSKLDPNQYRTHRVESGYVTKVNDKGIPDFDSIHIGLTGIKDYEIFWQELQKLYDSDPGRESWSDVHVIEVMLNAGYKFKWVPYKIWLDTGNLDSLKETETYFQNQN